MNPLLRRIVLVSVAMAVVGFGLRACKWAFTSRETTDEVTLDEPLALPPDISCFPGRSVEASQVKTKKDSLFPADARLFSAEWYSNELRAMNEPSLLSFDPSSEVYRFLWLRSFNHPISVRVWHSGDEYFIAAIEMSASASNGGKEFKRKSRRVTPEEWSTLTEKLEKICFWSFRADLIGSAEDGARWIVEGLSAERYHVIDLQSPTQGSYRDACLYLLKISDLGIDEKSKDIY